MCDDVDIERPSPPGGDHITVTARHRITLQSPYATAAAYSAGRASGGAGCGVPPYSIGLSGDKH